MRARLLSILAGAVAALAVLAPAARAMPECADAELWARPGVERTYWFDCEGPGPVAVARGPQHGEIRALWGTEHVVRFAYSPHADVAATDTIELALGAGKTLTVTIHVLPSTQNTAPTCEPIRHAQRTDGQGQEVLVVTPRCHDAEHDTLLVHAGGGPGAFELLPELTGGYATYWLGAHLQYRTAAATGTEVATYWAVDELGARSQDAPITLAFGPDANLPAECYLSTGDPRELVVRPGVPRNFGLYCQDPEEDAFTLRLGPPPRRGAITAFAPEPVTHHGLGAPIPGHQRVDVTYVPGPGSTGSDELTVVAESAIDSAAIPITLRSAGAGEDSPPSCAHAGAVAAGPGPVDIETTCVDAEGDPVQAWITTPPVHGTAEPPVVAPGRFGMQRMTVRYTPAPGSGGRDRVGVTVAGFGELFFEVAGPAAPPVSPAPPPPAPGQRTAADRVAAALGVRAVRLVRRTGVATIYAPRQGIRRVGGRPALAVVCARRCGVDARTRYAQRQRIAVAPARVGVITMPWGALAARKLTRLTFTLRIRAAGVPVRRAAVRVRVRR